MVVWVARRVSDLGLADRVVVATDAPEIQAVVRRAGYEAVMTSDRHETGTERVSEVVGHKDFRAFDLILNVQGDEPLVAAAAILGSVARLHAGDPIGTAAGSLDAALANDPARVKVVVDAAGHARYFSRAPIPFDRDGSGAVRYHQHVGVYAYTRDALERWVRLAPVPEERWERLEQLRPLLHGMPIGVTLFAEAPAPGVDTAADAALVERLLTQTLKEVTP